MIIKKLITLTAVRPPARFGVIDIKGNIVKYFREKNLLDTGWINGGFFVIQPKFIDRKSTRLNSSHSQQSRMPSSA